ncbi:CxxC motif protein [Haloarcula virus Hardyhisp2]|uniref:CxxC motif protein n=1 Tax=Haloarcula virus Hardyhisp2 TaxID=2811386 RepID=A0A898KA27_9VIRU|nr:CxxC motif protein [Haloarcula virus Hardyhisp2]QSJ05022.1 CxxC motif protein [Haloarcula virus Hardyhisp2]
MSNNDLICRQCGATASYADAAIFDAERTCKNDTKHVWEEQ